MLESLAELAKARQDLSAHPDHRWSYLFASTNGRPRFLISEAAPDFSTYVSFGDDVITGDISWDLEAERLVFQTVTEVGPDLEAFQDFLDGLDGAAEVRSDAPPNVPVAHPFPIQKALLDALLLSPEPWDFLYAAGEPEQDAILELYPEGGDAGVALGLLLDGRQVFTGRVSYNLDGDLEFELPEAQANPFLTLLKEDYGFAFAALDTAKTVAPPVDAPSEPPRKLPSAADVARLRGMLKNRGAALQKAEAGKFVFFANAADGAPLLVISKPGVAVEAAMRLAGAEITAEGDYRCIVPGGVELSNCPTFDFSAVSAELGLKFRFAKV